MNSPTRAATSALQMNLCEECGLPILACNALALYRIAKERLDLGRIDEAKQMAASAWDCHQQFEKARRAKP